MRSLFSLTLCLFIISASVRADDWPQWLGPKRDGVWREKGILKKFPDKGPTVRWKTAIGAGYAGPAVVGNRVYIADRILDEGVKNPDNPFAKDVVSGKERVLCLDDKDGTILWKHEYDCKYQVSYPSGPRTTPVVHDGKVYTLGAMGDLLCLDAAKGTVIWSKNFPKDYEAPVPLWGFSAHPLIDGDKLICLVGGEGSVGVAFDRKTGKELWKALSSDELGYCPPMIFEVGGKRQLIIWHPESVNGLDPETGKVLWTEKSKVNQNLTIPTPQLDGDRLFLTSFYNGSMMLQFKKDAPGVSVLWKGKHVGRAGRGSEFAKNTDGLHSIMTTPILKDGHIYGVCSYGELRCLKAGTGERVWSTLQATSGGKEPTVRWAHAFITPHEDRYILFNEKGDLIIANLSPKGYEEISRVNILEPDNYMARGRAVVWSHPAFANKCIYARNDQKIVCISMAE